MASELPVAEARVYIDRVIVQEGGWVLTSNKDDPDGGWTYAGVTAINFGKVLYNAGQQKYPGPADLATFKDHLREAEDVVRTFVYKFYYDEFYAPLYLDQVTFRGKGPLLSCAANLGLDDAVFVLQEALNALMQRIGINGGRDPLKVDGHMGPATYNRLILYGQSSEFKDLILQEWMRRYISIVQRNAVAWRKYAELLERRADTHGQNTRGLMKPEVLRATSLEGWFNRIEYWRF